MKLINIQHVAYTMTLNCTLKCKRCSMLSPYLKESYNPSFETLKRNTDALLRIVDKVEFVNITGGEPLLRTADSTLASTLGYLSGLPFEKLEKIRIYTSGTIVPSDAFCEEIVRISSRKTFWFEIDDYGKHSVKLEELINKLKFYNIKYNVRDYSKDLYFGGWVDFRLTNEKKRDIKSAKKLYQKCSCGEVLCVGFINGVIVACPATYVRYMCGEIDKDHAEVIDLFGDREQMREKWYSLSNATVFESCIYCPDGIGKDSERFTPAEQVTREEIEEYRRIREMRY
jgi:organic radical activating enzyme